MPTVIRWIFPEEAESSTKPTPTDLLAYANELLENNEEFRACLNDTRLKNMDNVKKLLNDGTING